MRKFAMIALMVAGSLSLVGANADVKSGLPEGEKVGAYYVRDITGPSAGKSLCYRCQYGNKPVVNVFTRTIDDRTVDLFKKLDAKLADDAKLKAFVTFLTDDHEAAEAKLKEVAKKHGIKKLPLTTFENAAGPENYKIAKEADTTVMMWVNSEVKVNHAYEKGVMCEQCVGAIVADIGKICD